MPFHLYRFRSPKFLLGPKYQELERQEIYLPASDALNDPMEGYKDVYWRGDPVLWRNLLRHYMYCLTRASVDYYQVPNRDVPNIYVMKNKDDLPTDEYKALVTSTTDQFLNSPVANAFVRLVSTLMPLRREGVSLCLSHLHLVALKMVWDTIGDLSLLPRGAIFDIPDTAEASSVKLFAAIEQHALRGNQRLATELTNEFDRVSSQQRLGIVFRKGQKKVPRKRAFLLLNFPGLYVDSLVSSLIHPPWYTACFSANCTNASMWGTYADGHKGAALIFDAGSRDSPSISLDTPIGMGPDVIRGISKHSFQKVVYRDKAPEVDFFKFLGQVPSPRYQSDWLSESTGARSDLINLFRDLDSWRKELHDLLDASAVTKLTDWQHEDEYRIVKFSYLNIIAGNQNAQYDFAALSGIVFGMAMSAENKLAILNIITKKCRKYGRSGFQFFEATYNRATGKIEAIPATYGI